MIAIVVRTCADFNWKTMPPGQYYRRMRYVLLLFTLLIFVGCETEAPKTAAAITKERAIAIAMETSKDPEFTQVTRSTWRTDPTAAGGGYWAIDLKDEDEELGKFYLIDGHGKIVGQGRIEDDRYF
jgi:hypothetical protein